jgi:hypothetical protein
MSAGHCQFNVPTLDPLDSNGHPLPLIPSSHAPPPSSAGMADKKVMAYTFRLCVTNRSDILIPFAKPDGCVWESHFYFIKLLNLYIAFTE